MEVVWRRVVVVVINSLFSKSLPGAREERILSSHSAPTMTGGTLKGGSYWLRVREACYI